MPSSDSQYSWLGKTDREWKMRYRTLEKGIREYTRSAGQIRYHVRVERRKGFGQRKVIECWVDTFGEARIKLAEITAEADAWQAKHKAVEDKPLPRAARLWGWL